ncbi:MAG: cyclic nucleotide-binding domain-containing protein, partial [Pseudomonadota bacterium]
MKPRLSDIPFLAGAAPEVLAAIEDEADWFSVPAGWSVMRAGEPPDGVFFLVSGSLAAFRPVDLGGHRLLGYIRPGEPVGEMALIAREPHSASVFAMRDSELIRLSSDAFHRLIETYPKLMERMARLMLTRARMQNQSNAARADSKVYALIATSPTIDLKLRARTLQTALRRLGKRVAIIGDEGQDYESTRFDQLERENDAVFLISPIADSAWFRTCLRQADRIWVLARADARPSVPLFPAEEPSPARAFRLVDVILLHHGSDRQAATTDEWRIAADAARLF